MKKSTLSLQTKVLGGLGLFFVFFVAILAYSAWAFQRSTSHYFTLQRLGQMELTMQNLGQGAVRYKTVAPRDYESYSRDVEIFHQQIQHDLDILERGVDNLAADDRSLTARGFFGAVGGGGDSELERAVAALVRTWGGFRAGLNEKLGPDHNEPRLEWGAEYIGAHYDELAAALGEVNTHFLRVINRDLAVARLLTRAGYALGIVFAALGVAWFYFGVTRRLRTTLKGCRQAARGDFGYQVPVHSNDELGALATAFNSLSTRAHLVLSVLDRLRENLDLPAAANVLWEETRATLPVECFVLADCALPRIEPIALFGVADVDLAGEPAANGDEASVKRALESARPQYFPDLLRHTVARAGDRLLRRIYQAGFRSAVLVPLNEPGSRCLLMLLAAREVNAFTAEQVILLHRFAPMIAYRLSRLRQGGETVDRRPPTGGAPAPAIG